MNQWQEMASSFLHSELVKKELSNDQLAYFVTQIGVPEATLSATKQLIDGELTPDFLSSCFHAIQQVNGYVTNYEVSQRDSIIRDRMYGFQYSLFSHDEQLFRHKSNTFYKNITAVDSSAFDGNKIVTLFTGAGGFDIGLEEAGFETAICVEIDPDSRETLHHNRPQWKIFDDSTNRIAGDIRSIRPEELLEFANLRQNEAALIIGGAPCQPFSNIGKRKGKHDPKNGDLFLEFVKMVKGIQPRAFIFENVAGITQRRHANVIRYMTEKFAGLGYGIACTILNAADYGVGQRRKRFFLLGIKGIKNPAFPLPTHYKGLKEWIKFTQKLDNVPNYIPKPWLTLKEVLDRIPSDSIHRDDYAVMRSSATIVERMKLIGPGENFKVLPMDMRPNCWKHGRHQGQDTFGRLRLDQPSVTIRTAAYNPTKGRYIHPTEHRGLNTIEMAAIQSFPYEWEFRCAGKKKVTLVSAGRQIGNAVPPLLAKALGLAIKTQLS